MKQFVCLVCALVCAASGFAQTAIGITTDKTTSLVFPCAIKHVDRGTQMVLAQHLTETPTILLIKAGEKNFKETNLSVVTDDGSVYALTLIYNPQATTWVHYLPANKEISITMQALTLLDNAPILKGTKARNMDVEMDVTGIYIKDEVMFFALQLQNNGPIDYDVDFLRFFVRDQKRSKRTAVQEVEQTPLHVAGNASKIKAYSKNVVVLVLNKFTIPDKKLLYMQMAEKAGGRNLQLRISNRTILRGILLPLRGKD